MEGAFGKYLSSPLFTFTVGANKKEVIVHSSPLAGLSQSLNTLMTGEMIEAKTRHVDWSEVDLDTFARLCEFAYLRNYTPPSFRLIDDKSPSIKVTETVKEKKKRKTRRSNVNWGELVQGPAPQPEPVTEPEPELEAPPDGAPKSDSPPEDAFCDDPEIPYRERSVWTGHLRDAFEESLVVPSPQSGDLDYTFTPPENTGSWEDFTPVFLDQARLYVLADKYGIESLCQLVLSKLHQTLKNFKLYDTGVCGIIEFVRFVYSNTPTYGNKIDAMRNFVTRYVVSVLGQIGENKYFQELLEEGGPFVYDFWQIIWC
ncbi:uncharacterized protein BDW43DRAFT_311996 [Aspergillus alliaceus]|uniref:uncharacterized protein n=1 Tax=Petromyces alliaceus TaxID=209559 RepID=UPI0012A56A72|nr:uncharacterized protein BDW43DRAFT_311996 [Aspergillus alliaceus]KAB8232611.1 hypothetical protein BDW43DRAFT_311996 [Aspergillus alliaceus]